MQRPYKILCQCCGTIFEDNGFMLECGNKHAQALLITEYAVKQFHFNPHAESLYRYQSWLPIIRTLPKAGRTVTFQSNRLCYITGLPRLWIAFNGYWPEKGALLETATFKDLEAYCVLSRLPDLQNEVLVISSAGNTAAAFAHACSLSNILCLIIIPAHGRHRMQFKEPLNSCVKIVSLTGFADYYDAIVLANQVAEHDGFILEGGVKNVGRRDGLGTTLLSAVEVIGQLPDYYFQAIGSGAGAIAVHETAKKLIRDGRFGQHYPHLMLSQNAPFAPMFHTWKAKQRNLLDLERDEGKRQIQQISAQVLSNQKPPYSLQGGVFDILQESVGDMLVADNREVLHAMNIFQDSEGIDIDPAAGVALATLLKEVSKGHIHQNALVLLNITGGGWNHRHQHHKLQQAQPTLQIDQHELSLERTMENIVNLFR